MILGCPPPPLQIGNAALVDPTNPEGKILLPGGGAYVGEERYYKCIKGYVETGVIKIVCFAKDGVTSWSTPANTCTGKLFKSLFLVSQKDK